MQFALRDYREMGITENQFKKEMHDLATAMAEKGADFDKTLLFLHFHNDPKFREALKESTFNSIHG